MEAVSGSYLRLSTSMTSALRGDEVIRYLVASAATPKPTRAGVAFQDACLVLDDRGTRVAHVPRSPQNDIYIHIPYPLPTATGIPGDHKL